MPFVSTIWMWHLQTVYSNFILLIISFVSLFPILEGKKQHHFHSKRGLGGGTEKVFAEEIACPGAIFLVLLSDSVTRIKGWAQPGFYIRPHPFPIDLRWPAADHKRASVPVTRMTLKYAPSPLPSCKGGQSRSRQAHSECWCLPSSSLCSEAASLLDPRRQGWKKQK